MSLLLPDSGLIFWMLLSFGIVFAVLAKYGFPVIIKMVEGRKTYIDESLEAVSYTHLDVYKRQVISFTDSTTPYSSITCLKSDSLTL